MIYIIHLSLSNAYKLMCFDRNINGNKDVKFLGVWLIAWALICETHFSFESSLPLPIIWYCNIQVTTNKFLLLKQCAVLTHNLLLLHHFERQQNIAPKSGIFDIVSSCQVISKNYLFSRTDFLPRAVLLKKVGNGKKLSQRLLCKF